MRAAVVTPWVGDGSRENPHRPQLADEYVLASWTDITGQHVADIHPSPNEFTVEVAADEEVIAAIQQDDDYEVLWTD